MYKENEKRLVLGEGETIGHKHVLEAPGGIEYVRLGESIRFMLHGIGILTHDEHRRMVLPPKRHRSYHQVEHNPMDGTTGRVFD